jgi:tyrosyl-tRNA synthetase
MFRARLDAGAEVRAHELVYPVLQGWDSVELKSDLTIVGSDQLFNESMGRFFQERSGMKPQVIVTTRITPGLDGVRKQSKSLNNFISLEDGPRDVFGKAMSLPDGLIAPWLEVYTTMPIAEIRAMEADMAAGANPMGAKLALARAITRRLHGERRASEEEAWFIATVSGKGFPRDCPTVAMRRSTWRAIELLAELEPDMSRGELRRLIDGGGVEFEGRRPESPDTLVEIPRHGELKLKLGRRRFLRLVLRDGSAEGCFACESAGPSGFGC